MRLTHLNELELQSLAGNSAISNREKFDSHLSWCSDCAEKLDDYRSIVNTLNSESIPQLNPGFSDRVILRVNYMLAEKAEAEKAGRLGKETILSLVAGGVLGILMIFYYSGFAGFAGFDKLYQSFSASITLIGTTALGSVSNLITRAGLKPELVLFAALLLLLFAVLDSQLAKAKSRRIDLRIL